MAGRHLPIKRTLRVAFIVAALGAGPAAAAGEWTATPGPVSQGSGKSVWQVNPQAGQWIVTPAPVVPTAPPTPGAILDEFVTNATLGISAPPVPPTASVEPAAAPSVSIDENNPAVVALREAEAALEAASADLADVRSQLELATDEAEIAALTSRAKELEAKKDEAAAAVDKRQPAVDTLIAEAEKKAAEQTALSANPFGSLPGFGFAPVSSTVPVVDASLAGNLDAYLTSQGSPLAGHGATFVYQSTAVGLDPRLLVAISGAETSFGTYGPSQRIHNPFGMGPGIVYPSWDDSIASAARNLGGSLYKGAGLVTIAQIQKRWAPNGAANDPTNLNSHWFKNVSKYYAALGGDPSGTVFTDRAASRYAIPVAPGVAPGIQGTIGAPIAYGPATKVPGGGRNTGSAAVALAQTFLGTPYKWGGTTPTGFDCSGLVQYVYAKQGVTLPRVAEQQAHVGTPIPPENLAPGDAVFFADRTGYIHHEGMYVGNGYFIHAPHTGDVIKISSLSEPYYASQYAGARRY